MIRTSESAFTTRDGSGPFEGPSQYSQLCWWALIKGMPAYWHVYPACLSKR